jgi:hypothetical protein
MLNNESCTIKGRKEKKLQNEINSNKYGTRDQEVFGWRNNLKQNIDYNNCQNRNKSIKIELSTQP